MNFFQDPPRLGNQYEADALLREYLDRSLPGELREKTEPIYEELGALAGGELYQASLADRLNEPVLTQWDPWGNRVDQVELSPLWKRARGLSAEWGLVAAGYEAEWGPYNRVHQFAMNHLVQPSLDLYSCPLAMTDGAAATMLHHRAPENEALVDRAVGHLTSRDPASAWTSGQWMTERTGGSDVGLSETVARKVDGAWRLYGTKWFTSAVTSEMALTLGRPDGNGPGGRGLALFYLELRDAEGRLNGIGVNRLKDKLGTRKVPTAELTLDGAVAVPLVGLDSGTRNMSPMLNVTRLWNAMGAAGGMRRAIALTRDYAGRRQAFGDLLSRKPLHLDTLAGIQAEAEGAFLMAFWVAELLGRVEQGGADKVEARVLRALTPLTKLTTGKQAVQVASEALECFGGAGYVEDTGLPVLLRDAQVLPIWEGTTNVLSLDTLRALAAPGVSDALVQTVRGLFATPTDAGLQKCATVGMHALGRTDDWLKASLSDPVALESGARRFALTLGRTIQLGLLLRHAQWCIENERGQRAAAVARRFAANGVDRLLDLDPEDARRMV